MLTSKYQNELFTLKMFPKNKQNKLIQTKKDEIKKENHLNYATVMNMLSVSMSLYFLSGKT